MSVLEPSRKNCSAELRYALLPSPRTCAICGLGPCQRGHDTRLPPPLAPSGRPGPNEIGGPMPSEAAMTLAQGEQPQDGSRHLFPPALRDLRNLARWNGRATRARDDVAGHGYYVALYARSIAKLIGWPGDMRSLLEAALFHDLEEIFVGEILAPVKSAVVDPLRYDEFVKRAMRERLPQYANEFSREINAIVLTADKLDCCFFLANEIMTGNLGLDRLFAKCKHDAKVAHDAMYKLVYPSGNLCSYFWDKLSRAIDDHGLTREYFA